MAHFVCAHDMAFCLGGFTSQLVRCQCTALSQGFSFRARSIRCEHSTRGVEQIWRKRDFSHRNARKWTAIKNATKNPIVPNRIIPSSQSGRLHSWHNQAHWNFMLHRNNRYECPSLSNYNIGHHKIGMCLNSKNFPSTVRFEYDKCVLNILAIQLVLQLNLVYSTHAQPHTLRIFSFIRSTIQHAYCAYCTLQMLWLWEIKNRGNRWLPALLPTPLISSSNNFN